VGFVNAARRKQAVRWLGAVASAILLAASGLWAGEVDVGGDVDVDVEVDVARDRDPEIEQPSSVIVFPPKLKPLWLDALRGPEADLRRQAAQTIALALRRGMPDLADTAGPLQQTLDAAGEHPIVVLAAAQALIALDARQAAPRLFEHAMHDGLEMAQLVEPALARWDFPPIRKVWLDRLAAPETPRRLQVLAIRGLGAVGEVNAEPRLRELALARDVPSDLRLEAARAAGELRTEGLEDDARRLAADKSASAIVDRLVAASLVRRHRGEAAEALLVEMAVDDEPSVAAIALRRLLEIDPRLVLPVAGQAVASDDANVRRLGAESLVAWRTPEAVEQLGPMLDDPHPDVRKYVRRSLLAMAADGPLAEPVIRQAVAMLSTGRWRGLEQATLALVALDHKPAVDRLVALLDFERPEVFVTAAWGLRRLAVPSTLDAMLDKARRETERTRAQRGAELEVERQMSQLFEAFGQMRYAPSEPLLREYVPKMVPFAEPSRTAAIWALGHLHAGEPEPELAGLLVGRLSDLNPMFPELEAVRQMSAVSLGRMRAEDTLPTLRRFLRDETVNTPVGYASAWSIHRITGEPIPEVSTATVPRMGWFLEPID